MWSYLWNFQFRLWFWIKLIDIVLGISRKLETLIGRFCFSQIPVDLGSFITIMYLCCNKFLWTLSKWNKSIRMRHEGLCTKTGPLYCISFYWPEGPNKYYPKSSGLCTRTDLSALWWYFALLAPLRLVMILSKHFVQKPWVQGRAIIASILEE